MPRVSVNYTSRATLEIGSPPASPPRSPPLQLPTSYSSVRSVVGGEEGAEPATSPPLPPTSLTTQATATAVTSVTPATPLPITTASFNISPCNMSRLVVPGKHDGNDYKVKALWVVCSVIYFSNNYIYTAFLYI